jgi:pimeloyl-ACP methyl ester carboxylesterase
MKFMEFGDSTHPTIVLLHGGGLSWWSLTDTIQLLKKDYHVVAPVIDGHGEDASTTFVNIKDSARKLIEYLDKNNDGKIFAIGGLSLGAQIAVEVLSQRTDIAKYAILESPWVVPSKFLSLFTAFTSRFIYRLIHKKWFGRIKARELCIQKPQFLQFYKDCKSMARDSLVNIAKDHANYTAPDTLRDTKADVLIILGSKEIKRMDPSIQKLIEMIPQAKIFIVPGMRQGEFSLIHSTEYFYLLKHITGLNPPH